MKITWIGHSCFKLEQNGYSIITDPYSPGSVPGLSPVNETANMVLCSHEHGDHCYTDGVSIKSTEVQAPKITEYNGWHDEVHGAKRGPNKIHIMDFGGFRAAHLGDIGCDLTKEQREGLSGVDVLMIPVGGFYTIDAVQAAEITGQINPRYVIPMHYRDDQNGFGYGVIGTVDPFIQIMGQDVRRVGNSFCTEDIVVKENFTEVILMTPKNLN